MRTSTPADDDIIIPSWTYSTDLGVVYHPIREKRAKGLQRTFRKKTNEVNSVTPVPLEIEQSPEISVSLKKQEKAAPSKITPLPRRIRDVPLPVIDMFWALSRSKCKSNSRNTLLQYRNIVSNVIIPSSARGNTRRKSSFARCTATFCLGHPLTRCTIQHPTESPHHLEPCFGWEIRVQSDAFTVHTVLSSEHGT